MSEYKVFVPEFELVENPSIDLEELMRWRFDVISKYNEASSIPPELLASMGISREEAEEFFEGADEFSYE